MAAVRKRQPGDHSEQSEGRFFTPQEYLARERDALIKSEYIAGEIRAMSGGTPLHAALGTDVMFALRDAINAANSPCDVYNSDLKVRVDNPGPFFYSDAIVVCGEPNFDADDCLTNPVIVVEVLSSPTSGYDRGEKFFHYRRIASLRHYVLVEQTHVLVEHFARNANDQWTLIGEYTERSDILTFDDLNIHVSVATIYRRLPEQESQARTIRE